MTDSVGAVARVSALVSKVRNPPRPVRIGLSVIAAVVFVVIAWWAVDDYRSRDLDPNLWLVALAALVGTPLALALNAFELRTLARAGRSEPLYTKALAASLLASSANVLPLPGSVLVRTWYLSRGQSKVSTAVKLQAFAGLIYVASGVALSGCFLILTSPVFGAVLAAAGCLGLVVLNHFAPAGLVPSLVPIEAAMVASEIGRTTLIIHALDIGDRLYEAIPIVLANVISTATGVFPAGLGLKEALSGLLAGLADLDSALAITASATDRMATTLVLALMLGASALTGWHRRLLGDVPGVGGDKP